LRNVFSGFKVVVVLLVIAAVATVLISPDPTDDVTGVLHQHLKLPKLAAILNLSIRLAEGSLATAATISEGAHGSVHDLSSLLCVRLC
jgi:hypothetical protein